MAFQLLFLSVVLLRLHRELGPLIFAFTPLALVAGNFFCGWLCPLGTVQELLRTIGSAFVRKKIKLPAGVQRYAQYTKYLMALALLAFVGLGAMKTDEVDALPIDAYQSFFVLSDGESLAAAALAVLCLFLIASLFIDRPYCNYFCVNSVEYALPSWTRVFSIKRDAAVCVGCGICDARCPMNIRVSETKEVRNLQCVNCFRCVSGCPAKRALSFGKGNVWMNIKNKLKPERETPK
jgi:polyferredoxin